MHLRDASVDLDGNIIVPGSMVYPQDDLGHFPVLHTDKLCIMRTRGYAVSPCHAERDSASGFLDSKTFGPHLSIPEALQLVITGALRFGTESRIDMSLQAQDGGFVAPGGQRREQPLSDWKLDIQDIDGSIHIKLSAALRAIHLWEPLNKTRNNYWSAEGPACRVEIAFRVDPITRVACYGANIKSLSDEKIAGIASAQLTSANSLSLDHAPVGALRHQFGVDSAGEWVEVFTSPHKLALTRTRLLQRSNLGFLQHTNNDVWPRIWILGIDLDLAASAISGNNATTLTLSNGHFGYLQQHHGFYDCYDPRPDQSILEVTLCREIVPSGLKLTYRVLVKDFIVSATPYQPGWIDGSVTLSWPVLILRFPQFVRYRKAFAAQERE